MTYSPLLTESEAAEYLRLAPATLARWRWHGSRGPSHRKLGGAVRYAVSDLDAYIANSEVAR